MQGLRDARGNVLPAILHGSWLLQADSILLECVDHAASFAEIHQLLDSFVSMTGMIISKLVFDLQAQWPVRRRRFWCHLLRGDLPELQLLPWDSSSLPRTLGDIIPFDAIWSDAHELDLTWDSHEMAIYFDEAYGNDIRVLQQHHITPTMLHSWANLLRACPCGCRGHPLSHQRLRHGGARGFGLVSAKTSQVRHFHSEEAAILCTVPLDFHFPEPPRTALSLGSDCCSCTSPVASISVACTFATTLLDRHGTESTAHFAELPCGAYATVCSAMDFGKDVLASQHPGVYGGHRQHDSSELTDHGS